jgi:hypothetical protein
VFFELETGASGRVHWTMHLRDGNPIAFAPSGDAIAWADGLPQLVVVPWNGDVRSDPDRESLERIRVKLDAGRPDEALADMRAARFRPSVQSSAALLRTQIESALDARKKESSKAPEREPPPFAAGAAVTHGKYGDGLVISVDGTGPTAKVMVDFAGAKKTLQASFLRAKA